MPCPKGLQYDDDDDEGDSEADSNGEDEEDEEESMRDAMRSELSKILGVDASTSLLTNSQMQLLSPTQKEFWEKEQQKAMEEEAAVMCSPRTKYLGGCIREKLAPLPRLVCRANRECRAIDIADYGVGDRSKFVSFMNSSML
jgi:cellobiose-specific phosphotransferase system component IIB